MGLLFVALCLSSTIYDYFTFQSTSDRSEEANRNNHNNANEADDSVTGEHDNATYINDDDVPEFRETKLQIKQIDDAHATVDSDVVGEKTDGRGVTSFSLDPKDKPRLSLYSQKL